VAASEFQELPDPEEVSVVTRQRARKGEGARLRSEILKVVEHLLLSSGSEATVSIRAVADATGVTPPSIYRHFTDKQHLLFEVSALQLETLNAAMDAAAKDVDDPVAALQTVCRTYVRFGVEHPEHYRIMFMGLSSTTPAQWTDLRTMDPVNNLIARLEAVFDSGLAPATDQPAMALHLWASIHGLTSLLVARPMMSWPDLDTLVEQHVDLCMRSYLREEAAPPAAAAPRRRQPAPPRHPRRPNSAATCAASLTGRVL